MAGNPHFCPQCGHVGPPAHRMGAAWFYVLMLSGWAGVAVWVVAGAFPDPAAIRAHTALAIIAGWAACAAPLLWGAWANRAPICAACGWQHTRPATAQDAPASR